MKHQTSISRLMLLLAAIVLTWVSCKPGRDWDPEKAQPEIIPLWKAKLYQKRFLAARDSLWKITNDTFLAHNFVIPNAETFSRDAIRAVLDHPHADSLRIYYGTDSLGVFHLLMLGVDIHGKEITRKILTDIPSVPLDSTDAVENGQTCPPCMVPFN